MGHGNLFGSSMCVGEVGNVGALNTQGKTFSSKVSLPWAVTCVFSPKTCFTHSKEKTFSVLPG